MQDVQQKLEAFLAQEKEQKERAQRCFVSYLRSVYLMKNKEVFDVFKLQIGKYACSLGLAVAPRVRFLNKAQAQRAETAEREEEELRALKAGLRRSSQQESDQSSESESTVESSDDADVERSEKKDVDTDVSEEDDGDDLRDLDLLKVKKKDVFNLTGKQESPLEILSDPKKKTEKETKFKEAKKILKRNFKVNTKVAFGEEGIAVQVWPPVQRVVSNQQDKEEEDDEVSGINVEKARQRLKREDQEFDKQEYSLKVKAKHREKRLKAKAARRETGKHRERRSDEEEDEVVAYLANHSEDEFDPSTLPDPDQVHEDKQEQVRSVKRLHSSVGSEEEATTMLKRKKVRQQEDEHAVLDTGLSLAEDEELVLNLLGGRR